MKRTTMNRVGPAAAVAAAVALSGCSFAPPAEPPAPPTPSKYTAGPAPEASVTADGVAQHFTLGARTVPNWWPLYGSDTLDAWVAEGLRNSPSLQASRHTLEAARQLLRAKVGDTMLPSVDAGALTSRQRSPGLPGVQPSTGPFDVYAGRLTMHYTFDLFGAGRNGVKQASAQVDQQSYEFDAARRALAANIVMAAIDAASLAEQLSTSERLSALAHEQADLTERRYRLGAASHDDLLAAQQDAASFDTSLPPLRTQALRARHALAVLMGRTPDQASSNLALEQLHLPGEVPVSVPSELLRQRPDVLAAEAVVHAASAQVGVATAKLFPQITLSGGVGTAGFNPSMLFTGPGAIWGAGAAVTQPIFHGGALMAQRKAALAEYDAALAQYQQVVLRAFQDVADSLTALDQDALAMDAAQSAELLAKQSYLDSSARYRLGSIPYPAMVLSARRWQTFRLSEIQARAARLTGTAALFQAMGGDVRQ